MLSRLSLEIKQTSMFLAGGTVNISKAITEFGGENKLNRKTSRDNTTRDAKQTPGTDQHSTGDKNI